MSKTSDIATIAVVALLGAGGFLIYKNRNEIGNFFGGIGSGVQNFTDGIGKGVGDFTDGVGKWYGDTIEGIQKGVDDAGKEVGSFFGGIVDGATNFFSGVGMGLQNTITGIQKGVDDFTAGAGDFFGGIASGANDIINGIGDFFSGKRDDEGIELSKEKQIYESVVSPITSKTYKSIYGDGVKRVIGVDGRDDEDKPKEKPQPVMSQKELTQSLAKNKELKQRGKLLRELLGLE